ncbi:structural maintenance of chromosomes protein 4-like [Schistocerca piceifrons]|uniref:structural maintenance of chromosomes protein 4-like n=1 Tax=Schistocerca piceifrons TaxID=274613 RepID=UPI001F5FCCE2|nr:structural maintenance of chromosomes protein 4-like [Schistocerca piceifrons]
MSSDKVCKTTEEEIENDSEKGSDSDDSSDEEGGIRLGDIYIPPGPKPVCSFDSKGPRLMITHIDNENFKSYAGKQILGPFHPCFNSILGANGSGKSNVIDSLLFVFGYRSTKIRSKKVSVLIHKSETRQDIKSCSVVVHFVQVITKDYQHEIVKNSSFSIGRTAFLDNSSYYTLNNRRVKFNAISKLLREHGIDLDHNRFLILQGEVEQISLMKPKGMTENETGLLEFLEDIIGTSRFKEPIAKLRDKLEELNTQKTDKMNSLKIVQKEREELEGPKEKVVLYLRTENEIAKHTNELMQKYMKENQQLIDIKEQEKAELQSKLKEKGEEVKEIQLQKKKVKEQIQGLNQERDKLIAEKDKLNAQFQAYNNEDASLQTEVDVSKKTISRTNELLADEKKKLLGYENQPGRYKGDVENLVKQEKQLVEDYEKKDAALKKVLSGIKEETEVLCKQKNELQTQLAELQKVVDEKKSQYEIAKSELDVYVLPEKTENEKLKQLKNALQEAQEILQAKREEEKQILQKLPAMEKQMMQTRNEREQLEHEERKCSEELRVLRMKLEEAHSAMSMLHSNNKVVDHLMQCKAKGFVPGLFGRLGDLGAIDKKYDVAISTACGQLDHIVVDTVRTAQKCIELLRQSKVGQAAFIALEHQEKFRSACENPPKTPENAPRIVDLVKLEDERIRVAFYFALRDTLVADNVAQASRISFSGSRRFRVVTLQGNIVEASGAMIGGGRGVRKGRIGQKVAVRATTVTQDTVEELERKMRECQQRLSTVTENMQELDRMMSRAMPEMRILATELQKIRSAIKTLVDEMPTLETQVKKQEQKVKQVLPELSKVKALTARLQETKEAYDDALEKAQKVNVKVESINLQIEGEVGKKVDTARKQLDESKKKLTKKRQDIGKTNGLLKTAERNAEKSKKKIEEMEKEVKEAEKIISVCREKRTRLEDLAKEVLVKMKDVIEEISDKETKISALQMEIANIEKTEFERRAEAQEIEGDIDVKQRTIAEYKGKFPGMKKTMKSLKMNPIPGETVNLQLPTLTDEQIDQLDVSELQYKLAVLEGTLPQEKPDFAIVEEYMAKERLFLERFAELDEVRLLQEKALFLYDEARKQRILEFMTGYTIITRKLKELYQMITLGGDAEFELVDSMDPFTEGIVFSVRPPQKSWKNISNLSGGEKTLSSLALIFALHFYKPSPLFVMDEIDAALDFKNVSIVGNYIKNRTKNSQFIVISLRSNMFELADRLVGIFKVFDCTKSITINPDVYAIEAPVRRELLEEEIEYEIVENENEEAVKDDDGLLDLPNNRKALKRRVKVKRIGDNGDQPSLQIVLQTAFSAMMKELEKSSPVLPTRQEIEERIRRRSGIDAAYDQDAYAALMEEMRVKKKDRKREGTGIHNGKTKVAKKISYADLDLHNQENLIKDEGQEMKTEIDAASLSVKEEMSD